MRVWDAACGKKFNWYSYGGSVSMYTACGCGLRVWFAACGNFQSGIKFCCKLHRTFFLLIFKVIWYQNLHLIKHNGEIFKIGQQIRKLWSFK